MILDRLKKKNSVNNILNLDTLLLDVYRIEIYAQESLYISIHKNRYMFVNSDNEYSSHFQVASKFLYKYKFINLDCRCFYICTNISSSIHISMHVTKLGKKRFFLYVIHNVISVCVCVCVCIKAMKKKFHCFDNSLEIQKHLQFLCIGNIWVHYLIPLFFLLFSSTLCFSRLTF